MTTVPETATSDWTVADLLDIYDREDHPYERVLPSFVQPLCDLFARLG
jgi:hypothetical protein